MGLQDVHSVMQTVIAGLREENQLGYDPSNKAFVVKNQSSTQFPASVLFSEPQVAKEVFEFVASNDVEEADLALLLAALKARNIRPQEPFTKIVNVAEKCLQLNEEIRQVRKQYRASIHSGPVDLEKLKTELQASQGIKIVLAKYPQEKSHTVYCYSPETRSLCKAQTKGLGPDSIKEIQDVVARKWAVEKVFRTTDPKGFPKLKLFCFQSTQKLSMRDFTTQPVHSVFIQASPNILRFRAFHLFKKPKDDTGFVYCLFSKNLQDLTPTLKVMDVMMQVFDKYQELFVSSSQRNAPKPAAGKVLLEYLQNSTALRVHYYDVGEAKVKHQDFLLSEKDTLDSVTQMLTQFTEKLQKQPEECMQQVKEKFFLLPEGITLQLNETGHEFHFFNPFSNKQDVLQTKGIGPQAVQEGIDRLLRMRKAKQVLDAFENKDQFKIQNADDYSHFIITFHSSQYPEVSYKVTSQNLDDLANAVALAREQRQELETLRVSDLLLRSLSSISTIEIPKAPAGIDIKDLEALFDKINWIDPEATFYRDPSKLQDDGKLSSVERYRTGIRTVVAKSKESTHDELFTLMSHIVSLLKKESDPQLFTQCLLDLAEGGLHCEGRNLGVAFMVYRTLHRNATASGKEIPYGIDLIHRWLDDLKIDIISEMVAAGNNPQSSHEWLFYIKTLLAKGIALPDSLLQRYKDAHVALGKFGKYRTEDDVEKGFISLFNSMRIVDTSLEETQHCMQKAPAKTGSALIELLRTHAETHLLGKYPHLKEKISQLEEAYRQAKELIRQRKELSEAEKVALIAEEGENFAQQKGLQLSEIVEDQGFISADSSLSSYSLTRAGARALLLYSNMVSLS